MTLLRFDSVGGASGDMILAALLDLGVDHEALAQQIAALSIETFDIRTTPCSQSALHGTQVTVDIDTTNDHPHRTLKDIRGIIGQSALPPEVKDLSMKVFERVARAEATVHNTTPEQIHFHEVGAMDSIIDITASCLALNMLNISAVEVGSLPLGSGTVKTAHGLIPVPVPAVVELLGDHPVVQTEQPFELVTPTGAALLLTWKEALPAPADQSSQWMIDSSGLGFGHRTLDNRPNLLRATTLHPATGPDDNQDTCLVLECNIDDTVPELLGSLQQKLTEGGALDVFTTPVQMKKQRPGILLTVLCCPADKARFLDTIFEESTTFGVREYTTRRTVLDRRHLTVTTPYGEVRVKIGSRRGKDITRSPEHDDCAERAKEHNVSVRTVYEAAAVACRTNKGQVGC